MPELSEKEMKNIARAFVRRSMKIGRRSDRKFESVRILYNATDPSCERMAFKIEEECWRVGAHTLLLTERCWRAKQHYKITPEKSLKEMSPFAEAIARRADVTIYVGEDDDPMWARGLSEKLKLTGPIRQKLHEILDKRKVRWAYFGWPVPGAAKGYGCPVAKFRQIFFDSIRASFTPELLRLCEYYRRSLAGRDKVRITAEDGTDLNFRIKGRPVLVDDGFISREDIARGDVGLNIPSGEIFVAPLETTAEGEIFFENVAIHGFGKVKGLWLKFRKGKIAGYDAFSGKANFTNFLKANTGEKDRIAEFGIGCNPGARYTGGSIIIDEKIFGTVHIAIGNNTGAYHGKNKASSHLDLIKDMRRGQFFADGKLVMDRGKPSKL
jgi:aminopeptidase